MKKPATVMRNELASLLVQLDDTAVEALMLQAQRLKVSPKQDDRQRAIKFAKLLVERARAGLQYGDVIDQLAHAVDRC